MEDDTKSKKIFKQQQQLASNLNVELVTNSDRSLLDCSFQTAYENANEEPTSSSLTCPMHRIKSQALVDSNNEESSDGEGYTANSMSTKFTIGNEHEELSGDNDNVDSISCANLVMSAGEQQTSVGNKRSSWRERSLNNRSWRQQTEDLSAGDDHGDGYEPTRMGTKDIGSIVNVDNSKRQPAAAKSILIKVEQYNSMDQTLVEGPQSASVVDLLGGSTLPVSHHHHCDDLLLLASDGDPDGDQHQSIEQHNRALDNLVHLNATIDASRQRFLLPPAPPPTRTTSALDLGAILTNESHHKACPVRPQSTGSMMSATVNRSKEDSQQQQPLVQATNNQPELLKNNTERLLFTRRNFSGFHSDYSNQMQSVARIISANSKAIERSQMEERLRIWKKSNKIITHITENPFNLHLDYLDKLQELKLAPAEVGQLDVVANNKEMDTHCMNKQQQVDDNGATNENKDQISNKTNNNKQEELNNCASHLSYLYKKNPAIMDNSNDFRTLLYNIICCLLVQDDQVLSTASVGKMLEVIRAHLESASRVYSTAAAASCTGNMGASQGSPTELLQNQSTATCRMGGSLNSLATVSSNSTNESGQKQFEATNKTSNQLSELANHSRRDKPVDFRRISSVSYNDEHLINDLCDQPGYFNANGMSPVASSSGGRSCSVSMARTASNNSPWAYQEMSAERTHLASGQIKQQQQQQESTSQSSLELQSQPMMLAIGRQDSNSSDPMNDSGNGTLDLQLLSDLTTATSTTTTTSNSSGGYQHHLHQRRSSLFRPKQQPSYMSTDEYLSAYGTTSRETTGRDNEGDEDEDGYSSTPLAVDKMLASNTCGSSSDSMNSSMRPLVDVASRRAELEWTLNKLINIELKHTWLTSNDTLRRAIRKIGVPNEIRGKVWLILIEQMIGSKYDASKLLEEARKTIAREEEEEEDQDEDVVDYEDEERQGDKSLNMAAPTTTTIDQETQAILKQIELDVNRTMPGHKLFDDGAEGGVKLRQILVAYSIHVNRAIAYCQGFNFIVALLLSVFDGDEEKSLRGFICIVDHIFPSKYYFDHYLTGARADQFLLADFICDQLIKNPTVAERKMVEGVTSSITLNWFISLFHGAVPTFVTPPSSCEVFTTIRNTAKEMYDIKLLLSIVDQIKLPKDSYFAIRRSFYMVQSSFNSDQFYMATLSNEAKKNMVPSRPLSVQQLPDTKPPALSFISSSTSPLIGFGGHGGIDHGGFIVKNNTSTDHCMQGPRVRTSADRTKVCIQSMGKLGRSHLKIIDVNVKSNERALMSPLRNCLVLGISNNGKDLILARQSSKRTFKTFREQDLNFNIHELPMEIFDGFYLEEAQLALVITHQGEILKIDITKCFTDHQEGSTETLMLRDSHSIGEHEKIKLRQVSMDSLTNLLWIYVECEENQSLKVTPKQTTLVNKVLRNSSEQKQNITSSNKSFKSNNPFLCDTIVSDGDTKFISEQQNFERHPNNNLSYQYNKTQPFRTSVTFHRRILMVDIITFDLFSAFSIQPNFGEITNLRTSLVAFCQLANPMSSQFSSRIVQIGPTGRYEQLLSFSDVVDYMVNVPDSFKAKFDQQNKQTASSNDNEKKPTTIQRYSSLRRLLRHSKSLDNQEEQQQHQIRLNASPSPTAEDQVGTGTLTRYYRSLMKSHSTVVDTSMVNQDSSSSMNSSQDNVVKQTRTDSERCTKIDSSKASRTIQDNTLRSIISSSLGDFSGLSETNYIPVNMAFIFRNGKIALFEFTETYAIRTRESQLDRYDYSRVIDVNKRGDAFIVTILTVFDKLIKVVI